MVTKRIHVVQTFYTVYEENILDTQIFSIGSLLLKMEKEITWCMEETTKQSKLWKILVILKNTSTTTESNRKLIFIVCHK